MNILGLDLNKVLTKQVQEELDSLHDVIELLNKDKAKLKKENLALSKKLESANKMASIAASLKDSFDNVEFPDECSSWVRLKTRLKFIEGVMLSVFGIRKKYDFYSGPSWKNLAVNYYDHKEKVIVILGIIADYSFVDIPKLKAFKMPKELSKEELLNFIGNMHTCTNGEYWQISPYYIGAPENKKNGGALENAPYSLLFENELMVSPDVFKAILDKLQESTSSMESSKLYKLYKYQELTTSQIQRIGETLDETDVEAIIKGRSTYARDFITNNMHLLSEKTLELMFKYVDRRLNRYALFNWTKFPMKYQRRFLMGEKDISKVLEYLSHGSCKWTVEEKDDFFKQYYSNK